MYSTLDELFVTETSNKLYYEPLEAGFRQTGSGQFQVQTSNCKVSYFSFPFQGADAEQIHPMGHSRASVAEMKFESGCGPGGVMATVGSRRQPQQVY